MLDTAAVLVLGVYGPPETSVVTNPVYRQLDLAHQGRDIILPERSLVNGALSFSSVLSLPIALEEMIPRLAAAVDGSPETEVKPPPPELSLDNGRGSRAVLVDTAFLDTHPIWQR